MTAIYPSALTRLTSPQSFDSKAISNITGRHLRQMIGNDLVQATPVDDAAMVEHWVQYYAGRILEKKDTVTICDGEPGEGKSNFILWLAAKIRDRLGREMGTSRVLDLDRDVVYRLSTFAYRVDQSSRQDPSVLIVDEGVLIGAQGSSGLSDAGQILDRVLSIGRIQGCTIFVLHPSIWGLASFVRNRRAKVWMHVERRGLTTVFTLKSALDFTPPRQLPFKKAKAPWSRLRWPSLETDPIWAPYEANKIKTVKETLVDSVMEATKIEKKAGLRPPGSWAMQYYTAKSGRPDGLTQKEWDRRRKKAAYAADKAGENPETEKPRSERARARAHGGD